MHYYIFFSKLNQVWLVFHTVYVIVCIIDDKAGETVFQSYRYHKLRKVGLNI